MATKGSKTNGSVKPISASRTITPDDFPPELAGEFSEFGAVTSKNIGTIATLAVAGGGYFGLNSSDDGGYCRLAIRSGVFALDRRFYNMAQFEAALAYCLTKLRDTGGKPAE